MSETSNPGGPGGHAEEAGKDHEKATAGDPGGDTGKSDLEQGVESLLKASEGVAARLFGPKLMGKDHLPEGPAISKDADEAISQAGEALGRLLNAAGTGMREHPLRPGEAVKTAAQHVEDPVQAQEGWSPLTAGIRSFGGGLFKVAEGVLDQVAPRKPKKDKAAGDGAADAGADGAGGSAGHEDEAVR